jgi:hypothetical protein
MTSRGTSYGWSAMGANSYDVRRAGAGHEPREERGSRVTHGVVRRVTPSQHGQEFPRDALVTPTYKN